MTLLSVLLAAARLAVKIRLNPGSTELRPTS